MNKKETALATLYKCYTPHHICPLKKENEHCLIFGSGNINASLMIIGEAPRKTEELLGLPFVGTAGKLLTEALDRACTDRKDLFITNVVKCRPQNNRTPKPYEIEAYLPLLYAQIKIIQPRAICLLGAIATRSILSETNKISAIHGTIYSVQGMSIMPTFHPAYIARKRTKHSVFIADIGKIVSVAKKNI